MSQSVCEKSSEDTNSVSRKPETTAIDSFVENNRKVLLAKHSDWTEQDADKELRQLFKEAAKCFIRPGEYAIGALCIAGTLSQSLIASQDIIVLFSQAAGEQTTPSFGMAVFGLASSALFGILNTGLSLWLGRTEKEHIEGLCNAPAEGFSQKFITKKASKMLYKKHLRPGIEIKPAPKQNRL